MCVRKLRVIYGQSLSLLVFVAILRRVGVIARGERRPPRSEDLPGGRDWCAVAFLETLSPVNQSTS